MIPDFIFAFVAAGFSAALALAAIFRKRYSSASWCFFAGMGLLAAESALHGLSLKVSLPETVIGWQTLALVVSTFLPGVWLYFSLTYSRGNYREFLAKWRLPLLLAFLLPLVWVAGSRADLLWVAQVTNTEHPLWLGFGAVAKAMNVALLVSNVLILMNLENTFRSAVGTTQWRIKFLVLGLGVVFGTRIYTDTQALLFSGYSLALKQIDAGALLIGCTLMAVGYLRSGLSKIDIYPSRAVLGSSVTVFLAGGYLLVVGVVAQFVAAMGGVGDFQRKALLVLVGVAVLAVLLLSNRLRQGIKTFVSHHFQRPQYDFRKVWNLFTVQMSRARSKASLCATAAKLISENLDVLAVTVWLYDEHREKFMFGASTSSQQRGEGGVVQSIAFARTALGGAGSFPFDLEKASGEWAEAVRQLHPTQFRNGGSRVCVPLVAGGACLGFAVLADRVNGIPYAVEELDLLKCIGDQVGAGLLNLRLNRELMQAKEMEAFQTMSAFFVHDLKNAASSLGLTLQNLPKHFDDPAFREDALRAISNTVNRIHHLIGRLSLLRNRLELQPVEFDLNELLTAVCEGLKGGVAVKKDFQPLPKVVADREQIQSVVTNLLLNAQDALNGEGQISIGTSQRDDRVVVTVSDTGGGMSPEFLQGSLFRPFQSTKKTGLGIGMFQSKIIVEAHRGSIQVESELGKGTTFRIALPIKGQVE